MQLNSVGLAGEVRCVVTKADGTVKTDTGFQKNLILNQGLDFFGGGKGIAINERCVIGSGNSSPAITQTKLDAFIAITIGSDITSDYSYVDKGDNLYRMWEQKKYRFTGLTNVNISEVGLVSTGVSSTDYYLTTRALIKDSLGVPMSISVKTGETLDIYYKIHKVVDTNDKSFVINVLDGSGGSIPYNAVVRPHGVGSDTKWSVSGTALENPYNEGRSVMSTSDLVAITGNPSEVYVRDTYENTAYVAGSYKLRVNRNASLNDFNMPIRTIVSYLNYFCQYQVRLGRVSDDASLTKSANYTLSVPIEISWGRYEGAL